MTDKEFLDRLDAIVNERHLLQHPFYQMWNEGKLTLDMLREYSKEYYWQVKNFPTFLSATHANCDDMKVRQMLLENLIEEENGPDNHPALWKRFAKALGVAETEIDNHKYLQTTKDSINILKEVSGRKNPAEGLAALYAYESQIPAVAKTKIEGLQQYYNIDSEDGTIFFRVHEEADVIHSQVTREALLRLCTTDEQREIALDAAREACDANNLILDGIYETYCRSEESCMA